MRTSVLSRSVIAAATLAIGSMALVAAPATAAPADVSRAQVLAAASAIRAETSADPAKHARGTRDALRVLSNRACSVDTDHFATLLTYAAPIQPTAKVDGLVVTAVILRLDFLVAGAAAEDTARVCTFGALTSTGGADTLTGTSSLTFGRTAAAALSGGVSITGPIVYGLDDEDAPSYEAQFSATGSADTTFTTTTSTKVATPKSKAAIKAAKKAYANKLKSAKASYTKAIKKAGKSKSKKTTAKKAYAAKKTAAKITYTRATATFKIVTTNGKRVENQPFSVAAAVTSDF